MTLSMFFLILIGFYTILPKGHRPDTYCSYGFQPVDDWPKENRSAIGTAHIGGKSMYFHVVQTINIH